MIAGLPAEVIELMISSGCSNTLIGEYFKCYGVADFDTNPVTTCEDNHHKIAYECALPEIDLDDVILILGQLIKDKSNEL